MTPQEFDAVFDSFRESAFRLETLPVYLDDSETEEFAFFLAGKPLPERSARTDPWLRRVADSTAAGKRWSRVHVVRHPLTDYLRFELLGYEGNVASGEDVRVASRDVHPVLDGLQQDFWLFDGDSGRPFALLMGYDSSGRLRDVKQTSDPTVIERCQRERDLAVACSIPLHEYPAALET